MHLHIFSKRKTNWGLSYFFNQTGLQKLGQIQFPILWTNCRFSEIFFPKTALSWKNPFDYSTEMILLEKGLALDKLFICLPYKVADFFLLCDTNMDINGGYGPRQFRRWLQQSMRSNVSLLKSGAFLEEPLFLLKVIHSH